METFIQNCAIRKYDAARLKQQELSYNEAHKLFSEAIKFQPNNAMFYGGRAECHFEMENFEDALRDAKKSISLDENSKNGYIYQLKSYIALGDHDNAYIAVKQIDDDIRFEKETQTINKLNDLIKQNCIYKRNGWYEKSIVTIHEALKLSPASIKLKLDLASSLMHLDRSVEAENLVLQIDSYGSWEAKAHLTLGLIYYNRVDLDNAINNFAKCSRLDKNNSTCQTLLDLCRKIKTSMEDAKNKMYSNKFQEAVDIYVELSNIDLKNNPELLSKLFYKCATAYAKMKNFEIAIDYCTQAIGARKENYAAFFKRARLFFQISKFNESINDCLLAYSIEPKTEVEKLYQQILDAINKTGIVLKIKHNKYATIKHLFKKGDYENAMKELKFSRLLGFNDQETQLKMIRCYLFIDDLITANTLLEKFLSIEYLDSEFSEDIENTLRIRDLLTKIKTYFDKEYYSSCFLHNEQLEKYGTLSLKVKLMKTECLMRTNKTDDSKLLIEEILIQYPRHAEAFFLKSHIFYQLGDLYNAEKYLMECLQIDRGNKEAKEFLKKNRFLAKNLKHANKLIDYNYFNESRKLLEEMFKMVENQYEEITLQIKYQIAFCLQMQEKHSECIEICATEKTELFQELRSYSTSKMRETIKYRLTEDFFAISDKAKKLETNGQALMSENKYAEAIDEFSLAVDLKPKTTSPYFNRAKCYLQLKDYSKATADAVRCVQIDDTFAEGYALMFKCYLNLYDTATARTILDILENVGYNRNEVQQFSIDLKNCQQTQNFISGFVELYRNGKYVFCIQSIDRALMWSTDNFLLQIAKAECLIRLGNFDDSYSIIQTWDSRDCKNDDIAFMKGCIFYHKGKLDVAIDYLNNCPSTNTNAIQIIEYATSLENHIANATHLFNAAKYAEAIGTCVHAMNIDKTNSQIQSKLLYICASSNLKLKKYAECESYCKQSLEFYPGNGDTRTILAQCRREMEKIETENKFIQLRDDGIRVTVNEQYEEALKLFQKAKTLIPLKEDYQLLIHRAICYFRTHNFSQALNDFTEALNIDEKYFEGKVYSALCQLFLGYSISHNLKESIATELSLSQQRLLAEFHNFKERFDVLHKYLNEKCYESCYNEICGVFEKKAITHRYEFLKIECLIHLGRLLESRQRIEDFITKNKLKVQLKNGLKLYFDGSSHLSHVCGLWHYANDETEYAIEYLQDYLNKMAFEESEILTFLTNTAILKELDDKVQELLKGRPTGRYLKCLDLYNNCLTQNELDPPLFGKMIYQRAKLHFRFDKFEECIFDCDIAIEIIKNYKNALILRATSYERLKKYDESLEDYSAVFDTEEDPKVLVSKDRIHKLKNKQSNNGKPSSKNEFLGKGNSMYKY